MKSRVIRIVAAAAVFALISASTASANHVAGMRMTHATPPDADTNMVDVFVTAFMSVSYTYSTAWLGGVTYSGGTFTQLPAVSWGDGSVLPAQVSPGILFAATSTPPGALGPVRSYRGNFMHTYPGDGPYTIRANSVALSSGASFSQLFTGYITALYFPTFSASASWVRNTMTVDLTAPGVIPTLSQWGLLALCLILSAAGLVLLRR